MKPSPTGHGAPSQLQASATVLLTTLIWGTTWAGILFSHEGYPPFLGLSLRFMLGGSVLLLVARFLGLKMKPDRRLLGLWLTQASCAFGISYGVVYWAEQWVPSGLTSVLFSSLPLFVALFSFFLLPEERLDGLGLVGIFLGFAGIAVIFSDDLGALSEAQVRFASLVLLVAPLTAGLAQVVVKKWGSGYHSLTLTAVPMLGSGILMGLISRLVESHLPIRGGLIPTLAVIYLALFGSALAFGLFFWLLQHITAIRLSMIAYGAPMIAVVIGTLFLDEPLTRRMILGGVAVLAGVGFVATPRSKRSSKR